MSLRQKILNRFIAIHREYGDVWIPKEKVCEFAKREGYSSENAGRRLRELESGETESGKEIGKSLEVTYKKGKRGQKLAYYRLLQESVPPPPKKVRIEDRGGRAVAVYD